MWEAIQANKRRSVVLVVVLGTVLLGLGAVIGEALASGGAAVGAAGAVLLLAVLLLGTVTGGESILLASAGARDVTLDEAPQLHNVVDEMRIASGLSARPRVCIIDSPVPNAFAVGLKPERSAVAVTTGLLARLDRSELQGVVGHEIGHIRNRDTLFLTLAGATVGAVIMVSDFYLRHIRFTAPRSRRSSDRNGGGAAVLMALAVVFAVVSPMLARILYFACSRRREYLADASSAVFTRYPAALAGALEKIAGDQDPGGLPTNRTLAPMYIVNPRAAGPSASLFSTHPPASDRIRVLVGMGGSFALHAYERSFRETHGNRGLIGARSLREEPDPETAPKPADAPAPPPPSRQPWRDAKEILHRLNRFTPIACLCGTTLKLPATYRTPTVTCPRCRTVHPVPPSSPTPPPLPGTDP